MFLDAYEWLGTEYNENNNKNWKTTKTEKKEKKKLNDLYALKISCEKNTLT